MDYSVRIFQQLETYNISLELFQQDRSEEENKDWHSC